MSTNMSPVTTFIWGGCPPTPLGQEKPVPCMEQVHLMGSWTMLGWAGVEVTVSGREENRERFHPPREPSTTEEPKSSSRDGREAAFQSRAPRLSQSPSWAPLPANQRRHGRAVFGACLSSPALSMASLPLTVGGKVVKFQARSKSSSREKG